MSKPDPKFEEGDIVHPTFLDEGKTRVISKVRYNQKMKCWGYRLKGGIGFLEEEDLEKVE